jgi:hypothetical protein
MGAVYGYATGSGAFLVFFLFPVFGFIKCAYAGRRLAEISKIDFGNFTLTFQQLFPVLYDVGSVWGRKPNTGDDNSTGVCLRIHGYQ